MLELLRNPEDAIKDYAQVGKNLKNSLILNIFNEQIDQSVALICMFISSGNATKFVRKSMDLIFKSQQKSWLQGDHGDRTGQKRQIPVRIPALPIFWSTTGGFMAWDEMGWG